jgi:hypothetical protein
MSALNEGLDRINVSYPVSGPATCLVAVVLYKRFLHYNYVGRRRHRYLQLVLPCGIPQKCSTILVGTLLSGKGTCLPSSVSICICLENAVSPQACNKHCQRCDYSMSLVV